MPMQTHNVNFFEQLLTPTIKQVKHTSMTQWHNHFITTTQRFSSTLEQAAMGGRYSHNMSFAFSAGYQSAIQSLFKPAKPMLASLCVTEKEGNRPKNIKSIMTKHNLNYQLNGTKSFITGANEATQLYIAVTTPCMNIANDRPVIKMISIPANTSGTVIKPSQTLPFVPDVSHGSAIFDNVNIASSEILEGDGYSLYVKPFRTHEDIHVLAATLGYRIAEALNSHWSHKSIEAHITLLSSILSLSTDSFDEPTTHVIFSGCRNQFNSLIQQTDAEFELNNHEGYKDWLRDKALLDIASKAHQVRTERAWDQLKSHAR